MTHKPRPTKRTTLTVLPGLAALAENQTPPGSLSVQAETIARRYQAIVEASLPSIPPEALKAAIDLALSMDTTHPLAHSTLYGMCRAQRNDGRPEGRLSFAADSFTPANLYAIIHLAEKVAKTLGPGPHTLEQIAPYLPPPKTPH